MTKSRPVHRADSRQRARELVLEEIEDLRQRLEAVEGALSAEAPDAAKRVRHAIQLLGSAAHCLGKP